ncbi:MAG TPA: gliding motility-associated ABC transporter permease subunit GldF [Bacteroidetes bacterium]|nr:gliding motility-associated ABC transporter permease subunit GldF [Bacteroidota bacterium]
MITIFRKEIASFFNSLVGYIVLAVFLVLTGLFFWVFDEHVLLTGKANLSLLFQYAPVFFILLIPAITMRSFAEEIKSGTIEFLVTKPVTDWQIILGKFAAAAFLVFIAILPTFIYFFTLTELAYDPSTLQVEGNPEMLQTFGPAYVTPLDNGPVWGAYIGLFALGSIFAALGILSSAITDNQVVAFVIGAFLSFFMYFGFSFLSQMESLTNVNLFIDRLGLVAHFDSISQGVVDTRDIVYFISVLALALLFTRLVLNLKRR